MNVLILGDRFIRSEIAEAIVREIMASHYTLNFDFCTFDWPMSPFISNNEIREFEGDESRVLEKIGSAEVVIVHGAPVSKKVLDAADNLKAIGVVRGGPTNINVAAATQKGIPVFNSPGRNAVAVVEFTVGLMISELRHIARSHMDLKQKNWRLDYYTYEKCGLQVKGRTIGLVGFGNISWRMSSVLRALGMRVIAFDPFVSAEAMSEYGVVKTELDDLYKQSDVVSVHARLTPETAGMFDKNAFSAMKDNVVFINTARGGLVNYDDLTEALKSGKVASAALDVFSEEPADLNNELFSLDNVTVTPHIAGATRDTVIYGLTQLAESLLKYFSAGELMHCMNPEVIQ